MLDQWVINKTFCHKAIAGKFSEEQEKAISEMAKYLEEELRKQEAESQGTAEKSITLD